MRNQVNGRFLTTSMNEKAAVSTTSASYNTQMKRTEQSIIIGTEGTCTSKVYEDHESGVHSRNFQGEIVPRRYILYLFYVLESIFVLFNLMYVFVSFR